ncbi:MAG TPA: carboxypeptidase-like regulatory domain-containing protein [Pyrinomonadaceae bacterium]|jgi:hypothetical protein
MKKLFLSLTEVHTQLFIGRLTLALILVLSVVSQASARGTNSIPLDVSNLSFTPATIDTTDSSQTVTVTIRAANTVTDVKSIFVRFRSQTGNQFVYTSMDSQNRISGDGRDGYYQAGATFPQYSKAGKWYVFEITAFDSLNNYSNFSYNDILARNLPTELQVINNNEDTTPPEISDFSFTPSAIHTANVSQDVTITVRVTDAKAGVSASGVSVGFAIPNQDFVYAVSMNRISGDDKDGIYRGVLTLGPNTPSGVYAVHVFVSDALSNRMSMTASELAERGSPSQLSVNMAASIASVSIGGRVLAKNGRGISRAVVNLTESNGNVRYAFTNPSGYYYFNNVKVSETYDLEVKHKQYSFAPRVLFVGGQLSNLNFTENNKSEN